VERAIAIIPARGGSKRIPRKNIKDFFGVPILTHTIAQLRETDVFDRIIVSTEDAEIARIASEANAEVMLRSSNLAGDYTTTVEVMSAVVRQIDQEVTLQDKIICCIYPVNPGINKKYLEKGFQMLRHKSLDYVFTAKKFEASPSRSLVLDINGRSKMVFPENLDTRSQDLPDYYHDAAMFYIGTSQAWRAKRPILDGNSSFIQIGKYETIDIDDTEDWSMMEDLYGIRKQKKDGKSE
jgi:pseudaminic acid cytidylyltransferase